MTTPMTESTHRHRWKLIGQTPNEETLACKCGAQRVRPVYPHPGWETVSVG